MCAAGHARRARGKRHRPHGAHASRLPVPAGTRGRDLCSNPEVRAPACLNVVHSPPQKDSLNPFALRAVIGSSAAFRVSRDGHASH